ncbi:UNVERIFIED_CONTAM: hypothetical protein GTU68_003676 [Idotea baltica]|nr:hypothetical protein [Idotea baltica]
MKLRSGR